MPPADNSELDVTQDQAVPAPRTAEKVERFDAPKIHAVLQDIEQALLRNISRGPCMRHVCRWIDPSASPLS